VLQLSLPSSRTIHPLERTASRAVLKERELLAERGGGGPMRGSVVIANPLRGFDPQIKGRGAGGSDSESRSDSLGPLGCNQRKGQSQLL